MFWDGTSASLERKFGTDKSLLSCVSLHVLVALSTDNINDAVNSWITDATSATLVYGPIGQWDTGEITDMNLLFNGAADFNEDINAWSPSMSTVCARHMKALHPVSSYSSSSLIAFSCPCLTSLLIKYACVTFTYMSRAILPSCQTLYINSDPHV